MQVNQLREQFFAYPDLSKREWMENYMKNRYPYVGLPNPIRKALEKDFISLWKQQEMGEIGPVFRELWQQPEREFRYTALELLYATRKKWTEGTLALIEHAIATDAWWDTVDTLAGKCAGEYFLKFPGKREKTLHKWIASADLWFNRAAILHQLGYKKRTDTEWLRETIIPQLGSKEFFIQKAIGWALRQYARTDALWVADFCDEYPLKPLSRREALKHL